MPANGRWDLIRRLKVNINIINKNIIIRITHCKLQKPKNVIRLIVVILMQMMRSHT